MKSIVRYAAVAVVVACFFVWSCDEPNEPEVTARIMAFSATPGVMRPGERAELRWHVSDALVLRLSAHTGSVMPDATQAWTCLRERGDMVCIAGTLPSGPEGWSCEAVDGTPTCRRAVDDDDGEYAPVDTGGVMGLVGAHTVIPDTTMTYRIEAEGNSGAAAMGWAQVVVDDTTTGARILNWMAWPSPALVGEQVTLAYRTEGCDQIDYSANPSLRDGIDWDLVDGSTATAGTIIWNEATDTRDFYLGCHPDGEPETVRIRSHITVVVVQQPEVCERIDLFEVNPSTVDPGTDVTVRWRVSNAEYVDSEGFHAGSVEFEGERDVTIVEETVFRIVAHGECGTASASQTVILSGPDGDGDADADGDVDGDADADGDGDADADG